MGVYGSPDTGNLYSDKKEKKKKPKIIGWVILIMIIGIAYTVVDNNPELPIKLNEAEENIPVETGTRLSPAKIGDIQQGNVTDVTGLDSLIEIELLEVKRKDEALEMAKDIYIYVELGENQEYVFAKFRVKNVKNNSNEDIPYNLNWTDFSYATSDYKKYSYTMGLAAGGNLLEPIDLYEGAEHEGWICLYVEKDDPQPKVVYLDNLWFDL